MTSAHAIREQLVGFALGELDATESGAVLAHVETCAECSRELDFLADTLVAAEKRAATSSAPIQFSRSKSWRKRVAPLAIAAGFIAALAMLAGAVFFHWFGTDYARLADRSVPRWMSAETRGPDEALARELETAMKPYSEGNFAAAIDALTRFLDAHPGHGPALFYRGIAHIEARDHGAALRDLEEVAQNAKGFLREHARWRIANLLLADGDVAGARARLREMVEGEFALNARELLERLPESAAR